MWQRLYVLALLIFVSFSANQSALAFGLGHYFMVLPADTNSAIMEKVSETTDEKVVGEGAVNFIDNMANRGLAFLSDETLSAEDKKKEFDALLADSFDMKTISRFSLGRYWRVSSKQQRREYYDLFKTMILDTYSKRFGEYSGQQFKTVGYRKVGPSDYMVQSEVYDEDKSTPDVSVDWRVRYKDSRYQVIDIMVEGVSMAVTHRSDFSAVIQRGGGNVQALINHLKSKKTSSL